jgi:hypothetical protein
MSHREWSVSLHSWTTLPHPIIINALGFLTAAEVDATRFIFALTMPPMPEIAKVRLVFKAEPPVT